MKIETEREGERNVTNQLVLIMLCFNNQWWILMKKKQKKRRGVDYIESKE
jgi:hypothetical protein